MIRKAGSRSLATFLVIAGALWRTDAAATQKVVVDATPPHVVNTFSPPHTLGAAIDRLRTGTPDKLLTDPLLKEILGAGWQTVTYRQNTELMVEAWHWNPRGTWSNAAKQEGYFVGSATPSDEMIHHSWAYPLPHRGFSRGDGNGWSRLTDGDRPGILCENNTTSRSLKQSKVTPRFASSGPSELVLRTGCQWPNIFPFICDYKQNCGCGPAAIRAQR